MATYCFTCPECGARYTSTARDRAGCCAECKIGLLRDYRAENVGIGITNLKREREHSKEEYAAGMLPSNDDYKSPSDPDGTKGIREWRETHQPAYGNKKPYWPGSVEKKTF